jgi:hypothetical protein
MVSDAGRPHRSTEDGASVGFVVKWWVLVLANIFGVRYVITCVMLEGGLSMPGVDGR